MLGLVNLVSSQRAGRSVKVQVVITMQSVLHVTQQGLSVLLLSLVHNKDGTISSVL